MIYVVNFFVAIFVSFIASIPIGAVNMAIVKATLDHGRRAGFMIGFGAIIAEAIYAAVPLFGLTLFLEDKGIYQIMYLVFIPIMIFLGIYTIVTRKNALKESERHQKKTIKHGNHMLYGFFLCGSNPMTMIFWTQITVFLKEREFITQDPISTISFLLGVPVGTYTLYSLFVWITNKTKSKLSPEFRVKINFVIGVIFILLAIYLFFSWLGQRNPA